MLLVSFEHHTSMIGWNSSRLLVLKAAAAAAAAAAAEGGGGGGGGGGEVWDDGVTSACVRSCDMSHGARGVVCKEGWNQKVV
jgi:hypothetical protein